MEKTNLERLEKLLVNFHAQGGETPPLDALGLSSAQVVYLDHLAEQSGSSLSELAQGLGFKLASVSTMVSLLVQRGFLLKESNPRDRRQMALRLSFKGRKALERVRTFRRARLSKMLERMDADETQEFLSLFEQALAMKKEK